MQISGILGFAGLSLVLMSAPAWAEEAQPEQLIDGLNGVFGAHAKMRAAHTKGICVKGTFTPTAEAAALSKAPMFAAPVPLVGRFSLGGGNPAASDGQKDNVRGIAMHFQLPDGSVSDLLLISAPIFVAKTPEQFLELLRTVATKDKAKIDAFFQANPDFDQAKGVAHGTRDAGELRNGGLFRGAHFLSHQRQGRSPSRQMEGGAGGRLQGTE